MKHLLPVLLLLCCCWSCKKDPPGNNVKPPSPDDTTFLKNYHKDLVIVNWNIEWFGAAQSGINPDLQEANAGKILRYLDADLYGICEVVDTARFGRMIRRYLGDEFRYVISPYPRIDQKLAVVYNRNIFRNSYARPFMGLSATASVSFASGRFPFLFTAAMVLNGERHAVQFILMHAKANADMDGYNRRQEGAVELKDSLDTYFNNSNWMVFGDFNDRLNGSIVRDKPSPYKNFIDGSARYTAVTFPLNAPGYQSTITYANSVIDQQIVSGSMKQWYVSGSARIRTDVVSVVPDYTSRNTSDHYPVSSVYRVTGPY